MGAIAVLFMLLAVVTGIGSTVCFILVLVEMFKRQQTGIAITCIVLFFCTGVGTLIAFVFGWMKSKEWNLQKIMLAWTACLAISLVSAGIWVTFSVAQVSQLQQQVDREMQKKFRESELQLNIETK